MPDRVPDPESPPELAPSAFVDAFGGVRGLVDSAIPATVFVLVRLASRSLWLAVAAALLSGVVLLAVRVRRGESLQQVGSGFFGLVIAVVVARATGTGKGFFAPGIALTALSGVGFLVSVLVGRPAVGLVLAAFDPAYAGWREHAGLRRACTIATSVWAATFFIRAGVATYVYRMPGDHAGRLLIVINAVKWPLIGLAAVVTVALVRRCGFVKTTNQV
ncbi:MAG: DUF3159 domain-containing protein [Actinomycetota bacterium]|nr:DUF3159 domain-containing protein [Actinomycetota bacterium]